MNDEPQTAQHQTGNFEVKYEAGHSYQENWLLTRYCCPNCSHRTVWVESGMGDYDVGPSYICSDCGAAFALPFGSTVGKDYQHEQRLAKIREVKVE